MSFQLRIVWLLAVFPVAGAWADGPEKTPRHRHFEFTYGGEITGLPAGEMARVWLPVPPTDAEQKVRIESKHLPAEAAINREPEFGNQIMSFEARADASG